MSGHRGRKDGPSPTWSRQRMLALLAGAALVAVLVVAGLVLAIMYALQPVHHQRDAGAPPASAGASATTEPHPVGTDVAAAQPEQDALASRAMPSVDDAASQPGPVSTRDPGAPIVLPTPTSTGAAGVPTGFPHTRQGALAQMAAIDQGALQSGSLAGVRAVITAWAMPGGPTASSWSGVAAMAQLLDAAGLSGGGSSRLALVVTPLMGLVKGTVGADFVVPCVDFEIDATLTQTARVAIADCERMVWAGETWMIGAGPEPADPPSVWPDTDVAISVGYRDLRHG